MIKKISVLIFIFISISFLTTIPSFAQSSIPNQISHPQENYYKAEVIKVINTEKQEDSEYGGFNQTLEIKFLDGPMKGEISKAENSGSIKLMDQKKVDVGDKIIILEIKQGEKTTNTVWDKYRLNYIFFLVAGFFVLVLIFSGLKGLGSIIGMITSFAILIGFIIPQILNGHDPLTITIIGSSIILFITIFSSSWYI